MKDHQKWLIIALFLGALLRSVGLFDSPPGPSVDEISNGIDAHCLWETGRDRHGEYLPFYLKAYNDYREGLFVIVSSPLTGFLTPWKALRVVSVLIGMLTLLVTYGAVYRIVSPRAALWGVFFLATDPQHVLWSRLGMEVVLVPLGVALAWWGMSFFPSRPVVGALATVTALLLTIYSGMMGKPAAAITFVASLFIPGGWFRTLRQMPGVILLAALLLFVGSIPAWWSVFSPEATSRFMALQESPRLPGQFVSQKLLRAMTYWSPSYFLFPLSPGLPDLPWASKMGYAEWGCFMIGMATLLFTPFRPWHFPMLMAAVFAVIPAALTNTIAPSRILFTLPLFTIVMGIGTESLNQWIGRRATMTILSLGIFATSILVANDLAFHANKHLDDPLWCDAARMSRQLHELPGSPKWADATIPFISEEIIHATDVSLEQYQGRMVDIVAGKISLAGITLTSNVTAGILPGTLLLTWRETSTANWELVAQDGKFKIVRWPDSSRP